MPDNKITDIVVQSMSDIEQSNVPITFGQVFAIGDVPRGSSVVGTLDGAELLLQVDTKVRYADGSIRHAVISAIIPQLGPRASQTVDLIRGVHVEPDHIVPTWPMDCVARFNIGGIVYTARPPTFGATWLEGPVVSETNAGAPLLAEDGTAHPHLTARFGFRQYALINTRVEVTIENTKSYTPAPQHFKYDAEILVAGTVAAKYTGLVHYRQARSRTVAWVGAEPLVHIRHNTDYLIHTRALSNYERIQVSEKALASLATKWEKAALVPMGPGLANPAMPMQGGRDDIGLQPGWSVVYLLSQDERAKRAMLGTADKAGSWSVHYRDEKTDLPISIIEHPYMTILGTPGDTKNPKTGKWEAFPKAVTVPETSPLNHDTSHQPSLAYLPYLVTGEFYYLEELQFWAMYNLFRSNPGGLYRKSIQGLVSPDQVRAQAWSMRTLGHAAAFTPDRHPLKRHFNALMASNLAWDNATYSNNPNANKLGVVVNGPAVQYAEDTDDDGTVDRKTAVAPWQDDFVTSVIGHLVELGFKDAEPFLHYKLKFPIGRMVAPGVCWIFAANYSYAVRASADAPFYETFSEAYLATVDKNIEGMECNSAEMAAALDRKPGDMGGYPSSPTGFPANMQPALAYAADFGGEDGKLAWQLFQTRKPKPNYSGSPQFNIVPRSV